MPCQMKISWNRTFRLKQISHKMGMNNSKTLKIRRQFLKVTKNRMIPKNHVALPEKNR
jgi:hypothetical protein